MAVEDLWLRRDGSPSARHGRGRRWRVSVAGYPSTSHRTKAEAERVHAQRLLDGPPTAASSATVGQCLEVWLAGKQGLSPRGLAACKGAATHVRLRWGRTPVGGVDEHDVQAWLAGLEGGASLKAKVKQAMSGSLKVAVTRGWVARNAAQDARVGSEKPREPMFLDGDELARLAAAARDPGAMLLLGTTGLRIGEACALDVGDVVKRGGRTRLRVRRSKSGRGRDVPVSQRVLDLLDLGREPSAPLLTSPDGRRLDVRNFRGRDLARAAEVAGLVGLRPHDLRHTAASLAIAAGADVKMVQAMLGHASARMTLDRYGHLWQARLDEVADAIDALVPRGGLGTGVHTEAHD